MDDLKRQQDNAARLNDPVFKRACELAQIPPTKRQASKWNAGRGKAKQFRKQAWDELTVPKDGE